MIILPVNDDIYVRIEEDNKMKLVYKTDEEGFAYDATFLGEEDNPFALEAKIGDGTIKVLNTKLLVKPVVAAIEREFVRTLDDWNWRGYMEDHLGTEEEIPQVKREYEKALVMLRKIDATKYDAVSRVRAIKNWADFSYKANDEFYENHNWRVNVYQMISYDIYHASASFFDAIKHENWMRERCGLEEI